MRRHRLTLHVPLLHMPVVLCQFCVSLLHGPLLHALLLHVPLSRTLVLPVPALLHPLQAQPRNGLIASMGRRGFKASFGGNPQAGIDSFRQGVAKCMSYAVQRGFSSVALTPRVDRADTGREWTIRSWRNGAVFAPMAR
eukprot:365576-Chlamydomonas_euryale.AAC.4